MSLTLIATRAMPTVSWRPSANGRLGLVPTPAVAVLALLYYLSPILAPFLLASILAYICNPLVAWLERRGVGRTIAVVLVILLLLALLVLLAVALVPLFYREVKLLSQQLPVY